jgi:DNA-binding GntR family transcriptional regulator
MATASPLSSRLAVQIAGLLQAGDLVPGTRLTERALGERFRVSRSPIRIALRELEQSGSIDRTESGGYVVREALPDIPSGLPAARPQDETYFQLAADRLDGELPDRVTERFLMKRYALTPAQIAALLRRISGEGWIERLPGNGWVFLPVLTSLQSYDDSYRFRLVIEPAAILEPGFQLNRETLGACRAEQQALVDGRIWNVSNQELFDLNSRAHEAIVECSHNGFFIDGLKRIDRVRRLIEYRRALDRPSALRRCAEHVAILDALLNDDRARAAEMLRAHLASVRPQKVGQR